MDPSTINDATAQRLLKDAPLPESEKAVLQKKLAGSDQEKKDAKISLAKMAGGQGVPSHKKAVVPDTN